MESYSILNILFITTLLTTQLYEVLGISWTCSENGTAVQVDPAEVAGVWYEIARAPSSVVPACLKVTVPEAELNDEYILKLDYINNVNNGWKSVEENLTFPWSEAQNGNFKLVYSEGTISVDVNFKYLGTYANYSLVCGYSGIASGISIFRLLSREKIVENSIKQQVDLVANQLGVDLSEVTWVQQDGRCNGASQMSSLGGAIFLTFYLLRKIL